MLCMIVLGILFHYVVATNMSLTFQFFVSKLKICIDCNETGLNSARIINKVIVGLELMFFLKEYNKKSKSVWGWKALNTDEIGKSLNVT